LEAPLVDLAFEAASEAVSMVAEAVVDSEGAFKTVEAMAEAGEEALATKAAGGSEAQMDTVRHLMLQLVQAAHAKALLVAVGMGVGVVMEVLDHRIATVVAVGMTRAVAVAHMMTDPADIAAAAVEVMETVTHRPEEVVATWSR
jgi:hypothetical protein